MARGSHPAVVLSTLLALGSLAVSSAAALASAPLRPGKSISPDEVSSLLAGEGMGLAHAAELNHYPGPRHLLDVANPLGLSASQRDTLQKIYNETIDQARKVGRQIVDKEAELSDTFARGEMTDARLRTQVAEIADLRGRLRFIHLEAHLKTRKLLSAAQVEKYEKLRGYTE